MEQGQGQGSGFAQQPADRRKRLRRFAPLRRFRLSAADCSASASDDSPACCRPNNSTSEFLVRLFILSDPCHTHTHTHTYYFTARLLILCGSTCRLLNTHTHTHTHHTHTHQNSHIGSERLKEFSITSPMAGRPWVVPVVRMP